MLVRDGMSTKVLTVGPDHTLRDAARLMSERGVGAAVVVNPDHSGYGILTERDILNAVGSGRNADAERAADHLTSDLVFAAPDWPLQRAADAMVRGGFRHLVVLEEDDVVGMLAMRDIVRVWSAQGAPHV
jgi:CBS domain-containing protein